MNSLLLIYIDNGESQGEVAERLDINGWMDLSLIALKLTFTVFLIDIDTYCLL